MTQERSNLILKATLMYRRLFNNGQTKEELLAEFTRYYGGQFFIGTETDAEDSLVKWIDSLREDLNKTPEQREAESEAFLEELMEHEGEWEAQWSGAWDDRYCPSCTAGDYGPGNPWDAPGMSIHDFI